jgi:hypothetical protein
MARNEAERSAYGVLVGKSERKDGLGRPEPRHDDTNEMALKYVNMMGSCGLD